MGMQFTGKVTAIETTGYASRRVQITNSNGESLTAKLTRSGLAFKIDNREFADNAHTFVMADNMEIEDIYL